MLFYVQQTLALQDKSDSGYKEEDILPLLTIDLSDEDSAESKTRQLRNECEGIGGMEGL